MTIQAPGANLTTQSSRDPWETQFQNAKNHITELVKHHKIFEAVAFIMTEFLGVMGDFTEDYRMGDEAKVLNTMTKLQHYRDTLEQCFDASKYLKPSNSLFKSNPAQSNAMKAYDAFYSIQYYLKKGEKEGIFSSSFVKGIQSEFWNPTTKTSPIFGPGNNPFDNRKKPFSYNEVAKDWYDMWQYQKGTNQLGQDKAPIWGPKVQEVTNTLTELSTQFSSQSSIAQSKLKWYESWDEQYKSIRHSMMSNFVNQEKAPNNKTGNV